MRARLLALVLALAALAAVPAGAQAALDAGAVRINAGGPAYTTFAGDAFGADSGFTGGQSYSITQAITGTADPALYRNERWGQFSYSIPVTNGTYDVRLHFVEIYYGTQVAGGAGKRLFGMDVLDTPATPDLANIDIYAAVGARAPLIRTVAGVTVTDGALNLRSVYGAADDPEIAAIELVPSAPLPPPTVTQSTPAGGATAIPATVNPTATFSRDMDPSTLTAASFTLTPTSGGTPVAASVAYDAATRTATLSPNARLAYATSYTARLTTAVKAADGTAIAAASWSFTTTDPPPPDLTPPTVTLTAPAQGASVTGVVTLTATAADNVAVEGVTFQVDGADLGDDTSAPYSRSWNTFGLTAGQHTVAAVARDAAGNRTTSSVITVTVTNPSVDPTGLVGAWGFEEGSGTAAADASPSQNNGALSGAQWTDGRFGSALDFDGVNARVNVPDSASLDLTTAFTLEAWARPTVNTGWRTAIMKEQPGAMAYALYGGGFNDRPSAHLTTNGSEQDTRATAQIPVNAWTHLATTWDGTTLRLFVNGTQVSSKAVGGAIAASTQPLRFGGNAIWGEYFKGTLDEIRIYKRALSAGEVGTDMTTPVRPDAPPPPGPEVKGQFGAPQTWPLVPVHIASLSDGRIAVWDGFDAALNSERIWDPNTNAFTPIPSGRNLFCAAHVTLPDGRLFIAGGHIQAYEGLKDTQIFNPQNRTWFRGTDMARARWYPTATTLPDGRIFVISGDNMSLGQTGKPVPLINASNTLPEIYDVGANTWTPIPSASKQMALYPFMFVLPNGKLFDAGPETVTRTLDLSTGTWATVGSSSISGHSAVMYRPGKILKSGTWSDPDFGGQAVTNKAAAIDMTDPAPAWRDVAPMHYPRSFHTLTVLPDGKVLASGGGESSDGVDQSKGVLTPEIWDPNTNEWTLTASHTRSRLYHSSALLLQDGRVLLAGGGAFGSATNETNAEIYSPPYLFKGPRPTITDAPTTTRIGQTITVSSPDASRVQSVSFVRMGSVTHNFDMDQRFMNLTVRQGAAPGTLSVDMPTSANTAPPGYYYVFLLDDKGVPSKGSIVKLDKAAGDGQPPTAPGGLTATTQNDSVKLDWTASTDNTAVTEYRVHRSTTAGFTPSAANRIATVPTGTTYTDSALAAGTHRYKVVAADAAGNAGPASNEASATVAADSSPPTTSVTAPADGATVSGTVSVTASASDDRGVASVQFQLDGADLGSPDTSAPYSASWNTASGSNGPHRLTAVARDAAGNATTSANVNVNVDNGSPPTVSVTAPAEGATVSSTINVTANAADDRGLANVQFRLDGANLGAADTTAPYSVSWDTRTASNGAHTLTAVARDTDANTTTSATIHVTVSNTVVAPPGLVAAYGFDETSGTTTADSSGNALTGTLSGPVRNTGGKFGGALSYDGVNDWVTVNDAVPLHLTTGMTLEAWVKPTALTGWRTVIVKEQAADLAYALYANTGTNRPSGNVFTATEQEARGTAQVALNTWTHLAATYDGATLRLYVNGTQVATKAVTGALVSSTRALRFGGNAIWSEWFTGLLDEVRVYNRALTATELQSDMATPVKP